MIGWPSTAETMARPASDIADRLVDSALDHFVRFGVDAALLDLLALVDQFLDARCSGIKTSLPALHLPGQFGRAAMRQVQRTLCLLACLLGLQQGRSQVLQRFDLILFAGNQLIDVTTQLLDVALARQRAMRFAAARGAQPAVAQPFTVAGDDRLRQRSSIQT